MPNFAASVTLMFNEVDLLDRFEQAASVGFRAVEVQAPYGESPEDIADRLRCHDLTPVLFNLPTAVGAIPGQEAQFEQGVTRALEYAEATGCRQLHCLAGKTDDTRAEGTFVSNLQWASEQARPLGVRLLIEPLNTRDNPGYFLTRSAQAQRIIHQVGTDNVLLQYDFYHMQIMEGCLAETVKANLDAIGHFQIGGVPGRNEPDRGQEINYPYLFDLIDDLGFTGWVGCEYHPRGNTIDGLAWAEPHGLGRGEPGLGTRPSGH